MARVHGRFGQIYMGVANSSASAEALSFAASWKANFETDMKEATAFGDSNKVYVAGLPDGSGSFDGFYDTATAQSFTAAADGQARKCYFYPTTPSTAGPYWYGTAFFSFNVDVAVTDVVKVSGKWNAASAISKVG